MPWRFRRSASGPVTDRRAVDLRRCPSSWRRGAFPSPQASPYDRGSPAFSARVREISARVRERRSRRPRASRRGSVPGGSWRSLGRGHGGRWIDRPRRHRGGSSRRSASGDRSESASGCSCRHRSRRSGRGPLLARTSATRHQARGQRGTASRRPELQALASGRTLPKSVEGPGLGTARPDDPSHIWRLRTTSLNDGESRKATDLPVVPSAFSLRSWLAPHQDVQEQAEALEAAATAKNVRDDPEPVSAPIRDVHDVPGQTADVEDHAREAQDER